MWYIFEILFNYFLLSLMYNTIDIMAVINPKPSLIIPEYAPTTIPYVTYNNSNTTFAALVKIKFLNINATVVIVIASGGIKVYHSL